MKIMKRIAAVMLAAFLAVPGFSLVVNAAEGRVSFTDPETKTGETVEVACALRAGAGSLESFDITLKYDTAFLAFEGGDEGVTKESGGVIKFSGKGDGTGKIRFAMKFQALQVGETKIEVTEASGFTTGGESVNCTNGNSTIKIAQGTNPVTATAETGIEVTVGEKTYNFTDAFSSADIPAGFVEGTLTYEGEEHKAIQNEAGTVKMGYLVNAEGKGSFFVYHEEDGTFAPSVQVIVSPKATITLLTADSSLKVPEGYQEVKLTVNENEFPAWQDENHEGIYLVYALNSKGEKGFYQYDVEEESYQRFLGEDTTPVKETAVKIGKLAKLVDKHFTVVAGAAGLAVLLFVIIIIVLVVKLRHRNLELDDLYDELELDEDDFDDRIMKTDKKQKEKKPRFKKQSDEELYEDRYDDEDDFDDYDDDFEDDLDDDFDDGFEDDLDAYYEETKKAKSGKSKKKSFREQIEEDDFYDDLDNDDFDDFDDDFEVDFIDLD